MIANDHIDDDDGLIGSTHNVSQGFSFPIWYLDSSDGTAIIFTLRL